MHKIAIISGSVRTGRQSHYVAEYFNNYIKENKLADSEILDLMEYNFPIFDERLSKMPSPPEQLLSFSKKIQDANIVIIVYPEYNGGYSASIKNAIDLLYNEWHHKPIGLVSVSSGNFGGVNATSLLQTVLVKIKALPVATFPVPNVQDNFGENGKAVNKEASDKRAASFMKELLWFADSVSKMK
jgi:NAD(P)H-dependent FMN reductase